jgi:hypothetical protein
MLEDIYAVGDGTDRWCRSDTLVPVGMYVGGVYPQPLCGPDSCFTTRGGAFNPVTPAMVMQCLPNGHGVQIMFCSD